MKAFRFIALLEGSSYLLLGLTMYLKYVHEMAEPNMIVGFFHGFLYVVYVLMALYFAFKRKWSFINLFWVMVAALLPGGTFVAEKYLYPKL